MPQYNHGLRPIGYAFPSFNPVAKCLRKVIHEAATTLVCPIWPTQPWYDQLLQLVVTTPILPRSFIFYIYCLYFNEALQLAAVPCSASHSNFISGLQVVLFIFTFGSVLKADTEINKTQKRLNSYSKSLNIES